MCVITNFTSLPLTSTLSVGLSIADKSCMSLAAMKEGEDMPQVVMSCKLVAKMVGLEGAAAYCR